MDYELLIVNILKLNLRYNKGVKSEATLSPRSHQDQLRQLPELITATIVNVCDSTRDTAARFRHVPQASLHFTPLKICVYSVFDRGRNRHASREVQPTRKLPSSCHINTSVVQQLAPGQINNGRWKIHYCSCEHRMLYDTTDPFDASMPPLSCCCQ